MFSSFSVVSAYCVIQLFSSHTIFPFVKQNFDVSATKCFRQRGKSKTKSNDNDNMRVCLICMEKVWSSVDKKIKKCH